MITKKFENLIKNTKLTKTEQIIAEYILHNFNTIGFMTTTDIGDVLNVSEASIFRLARSLGYNGFNDLKNEIKQIVTEQLNLSNESQHEYSQLAPIERFKTNLEKLSSKGSIERLTQNAISSIDDVVMRNNRDDINTCLKIIAKSRNKYICGFRSTAFVAEFFAFELLFLLDNVIVNTHADGKAIERIVDINSEDCVVLFAYPRYSKINTIIKQIALDAGAKIILVIDKITSELAKDVDIVLACNPRSLSYYNSIIPMTFICEILIIGLSKRLPGNFETRSDFICKYMDPAGLY